MSNASSFAPLRLVAEGLCLDRGPRRLVVDLDVSVGPGEALIVTGPNGTGKSTLLRAFAGLLAPARGRVRIEGDLAGEASAALSAHYVGHLEAARGVLTTLENLEFWAAMLGAPAAAAIEPREALRLLGVPQIADLPFAVGLAMIYFTFGSIGQSILIFTAIPMAAIGGVFALLLRGMPFSISAGVGFIALFGVAVLNGIVLIGEFNFLKKAGETNLEEIIFKGTHTRLRPILMTALVASLGFLPMALSQGAGGEVQKPLATVVIGGLITSTLLTLFVIPILYFFLERGLRVKKKGIVTAAMLVLVSTYASAQTGLTLDQSVQTALTRNQGVEAARRSILASQALRGTAREVTKTSVTALLGQYNSYKFDQNLTVSQVIPAPGVFRARQGVLDAAVRSGELQLALTETELAYQVKTAWYQLAYFYQRRAFLRRQDSLFAGFVRAAGIRFRTGETGSIEQITAQTRRRQVQTLVQQAEADIAIGQRRLQTLFNADTLVDIAADTLLPRPLPRVEGVNAETNPVLLFYAQQVRVAEADVALQRANRLPDYSVGYFNQSLIGTPKPGRAGDAATALTRFQGVQFGVAVPLFGKSFKARIQAAELTRQAQQSQFELRRRLTEGDVAALLRETAKFNQSLDYYRSAALPEADLLVRQANRAFLAGEIGYVEYLQAVSTANDVQLTFLDTLNAYNQSVLQLELTLGLR